MPARDTNVLGRCVVQDDSGQLAAAKRLIDRCVAEGQPLFVPVTVTLELEWARRAGYAHGKDDVLQVLSNLFLAAQLTFESERALEVALQLYREGSVDFADGVHVALATEAGEQPLWTFDKGAASVAGAQLIRGRSTRTRHTACRQAWMCASGSRARRTLPARPTAAAGGRLPRAGTRLPRAFASDASPWPYMPLNSPV